MHSIHSLHSSIHSIRFNSILLVRMQSFILLAVLAYAKTQYRRYRQSLYATACCCPNQTCYRITTCCCWLSFTKIFFLFFAFLFDVARSQVCKNVVSIFFQHVAKTQSLVVYVFWFDLHKWWYQLFWPKRWQTFKIQMFC